jgi:hypothetical protein
MLRRVLASLAALALLVTVAGPAGAIQYGRPDGNGHPYVGLVVFHDSNHVPLWRCTGTLLSETVVLSAGHCTGTDGTTAPRYAVLYFDAGPIPNGNYPFNGTPCTGYTGYPCTGDATGTPHPNPGWNGALTIPNTHDVGVIVLDRPYTATNGHFGALPREGMLDTLARQRGLQDVTVTIVGYGVQSEKPTLISIKQRFVAKANVVSLKSALTDGFNVRLSSNPGVVSGGTCFGDSGGPIFYNNTNIIVAVNSFVLNLTCKGSGYGFRVDTHASLQFIGGFLD